MLILRRYYLSALHLALIITTTLSGAVNIIIGDFKEDCGFMAPIGVFGLSMSLALNA